MAGNGKQDFKIAFLSTVEIPDRGFVGGMLITNHLGRPLEFQCTTPVKPNRTQQILYGPTLRPFILTELIGKSLIDRASVKPNLVLVDDAEILELRQHVPVAVAFCPIPEALRRGANASATPALALGEPSPAIQASPTSRPGKTIRLGQQSLQVHELFATDVDVIAKLNEDVPDSADLCEPFERVREALNETMQSALRAA